jgi:hypothetical protein
MASEACLRNSVIIQPIVEGPGDVTAVPLLIRRICYELECCLGARVAAPMKVARSKMVQEAEMRKYLRIASADPECKLILLFMDADDDCAKEISELLRPWIEGEALRVRCEVIVIPREFECWFISAIESLRGVRGISEAATSHTTPEMVRNPKAILTRWMQGTAAYHETADQVAFTQSLDLAGVRLRCRSFRRLIAKIEMLSQSHKGVCSA